VAALSTQGVENHWGKAVDNASQPRHGKPSRVFGEILASRRSLSTQPVDKPADSDVGSRRIRRNDGAPRKYG